MRRWIWIAALQIVALAVIAQRFSFDHTLHLPWNAKKEQCGLFQASEYVITSRKVVLPSGVLPAAGGLRLAHALILSDAPHCCVICRPCTAALHL